VTTFGFFSPELKTNVFAQIFLPYEERSTYLLDYTHYTPLHSDFACRFLRIRNTAVLGTYLQIIFYNKKKINTLMKMTTIIK